MRNIVRLFVLSIVVIGGSAALVGARPADADRGGVIKVRIAVTSRPAGRPVDVQASIVNGHFVDGDRSTRARVLRGDGEATVVAELTHTGRVVLASRTGAIRAVATYAAAPHGVRVSEAQWRALSVAHSGERIELQRAGSFVAVVAPPAGARAGLTQD